MEKPRAVQSLPLRGSQRIKVEGSPTKRGIDQLTADLHRPFYDASTKMTWAHRKRSLPLEEEQRMTRKLLEGVGGYEVCRKLLKGVLTYDTPPRCNLRDTGDCPLERRSMTGNVRLIPPVLSATTR